MSSSVKAGLWRLSKLYSFIRIWKAEQTDFGEKDENGHLRKMESVVASEKSGYLDACFDRNFSEQSCFLEAEFLHHLVHTLTVEQTGRDVNDHVLKILQV